MRTKQTIHNYRHGVRFPTPENLRRIREVTKGAVMPDDFVDQHAGASPAHLLSDSPTESKRRRRAAPPPTSAGEAAD